MKSGISQGAERPAEQGAAAREPRAARPGDQPGHRPGALWDVGALSEYLKVPVSSIYKMTARRAPTPVPHIRIGGKLRFRREDIDRWLSLLTVSNIDRLARIRARAREAAHGNHPQAAAPQR